LDKATFDQLCAGGHNRIPVWRAILADLDTPLSVYLKLCDGRDSYLFESVEGGETWGRYSIIGLPCRRRYVIEGHRISVHDYGQCISEEHVDDPLQEIAQLQAAFSTPRVDELPLFTGGLVGYFGYETVQLIEPRLGEHAKPDELGAPDTVLLLSEEVAVFDNLEGRLWLIVNIDPSEPDGWARAQRRLDTLEHRLRSGSTGYGLAVKGEPVDEGDFRSWSTGCVRAARVTGWPLRVSPSTRAIFDTGLRARPSWRPSGAARNTYWPVIFSRWCSRSA
jgi:anthranilate synthase component 1